MPVLRLRCAVAQVETATRRVPNVVEAERVLLITVDTAEPASADSSVQPGAALRAEPVRDIARACHDLNCQLLTSAWPPSPHAESDGAAVVVVDCGGDVALAASRVLELRASPAYAETSLLVIYDPAGDPRLDALLDAGADDMLPYGVGIATLRARLQVHIRTQLAAARVVNTERSLGLMLEITQALASSTDIQEILYTVVRRIADLVHVHRVSIVLVPDDTLPYAYVVAASDDRALSNLRLDIAKYPEIRHVLAQKEPLTIDDVGTHVNRSQSSVYRR
jgi:hypothetical protein